MSGTLEGMDRRALLKKALAALDEMQSKLDAMELSKTEPIAIIGMGCRFPGGADDPEKFWRLLHEGVDAITVVPPDRWNIDVYYDLDPEAPGKMYTRHGGFLKQVDTFDAQFFGISPREAKSMDPQQRLLLEVSWEALENAGYGPDVLIGSRTGVFVGIGIDDYSQLQLRCGDPTCIDAYTATGSIFCVAAGRLSYILGLQGPCMALDTACSSSLVTVHVACQSLRARECNLALAGGVHLMLTPETTIFLSRARALARDGRCKTFDAAADGYVRGEGCGVVVLKRLSDAVTNGDNILALIRGSAINHDGLSSGLTVPNGLAQQNLIREAIANAGVEPADVSYVEAHGTGTPLGDPIEVEALGAALCTGRSKEKPLAIGSGKTNIGHLEAAAGVASLIKVVLALQHLEIPPHLHLKQINPQIPADLPVVIPTAPTPWQSGGGQRIAGVSSFGFSGTNAHVVVEEAPAREPPQAEVERAFHLLSLSAKSAEALKELAGKFENYLVEHPSKSLGDICFTANSGRSHFAHRLSVVAESTVQLRERLAAYIAGHKAAGVLLGETLGKSRPKVAFLFTGQGAQYPGMGRQLYDTQPTFRRILEQCDELLRPHLKQPLLSVLYAEPGVSSLLDETAYTQPALFALEYALAELWRSWGIEPAVVMGHSVGEYAAACIAGVFTLEEGLKLIAERGCLQQALPREGEMAAVLADEERVAAAIRHYADTVSIAAINNPENIVISGSRNAVRVVLKDLEIKGIQAHPLNVSHAFHSPLVEPMLDAFEKKARQMQFRPPRIPLISTLTGQMLQQDEIHASYWRRHAREPVRFSAAMATLHEHGCQFFVEIGPSPTLIGMGRLCLPENQGIWLSSLRKGGSDWLQMLESLGALYTNGVKVDWVGFDRDYSRRRRILPTYAFQRKRYWVDAPRPRPQRTAEVSQSDASITSPHPLLGRCSRSPLMKEILFESHLSTRSLPFLADHRIHGVVVLPATAYVEMALAAATEAFGRGSYSLEDMVIREALILTEDEEQTLQLLLSPEENQIASFQLISVAANGQAGQTSWKLHVTGKVRIHGTDTAALVPELVTLEELRARCQEQVSVGIYYQKLRERGFHFGAQFQGIEQLWRRDGEALAQVKLAAPLITEANSFGIHPALLDMCFQPLMATLPDGEEGAKGLTVYMPLSLERFRLYGRPGNLMWSYAFLRQRDGVMGETFAGDLCLFDEAGQIIAEVTGLHVKRASWETLLRATRQQSCDDWLYEVAWQPSLREAVKSDVEQIQPAQRGKWLIFADQGGAGTALARLLEERGETCVMVFPGEAYEVSRAGHWRINPAAPKDFHRLLSESVATDTVPYRGVMHLWGLDAPPAEKMTALSLQKAQVLGCGSMLHLVQALTTRGGPGVPHLWLVTRAAQPAGSAQVSLRVEQAPLWGLASTIALEHPELHCTRIDLDPAGAADEMQTLFEEIWSSDPENQVAFRQSDRYVARLVRKVSKAHQAGTHGAGERPIKLEIANRGVLDNLELSITTRRQPSPGELEIRVFATGLNFKDVLNALGMYPGNPGPLGLECVGKIVTIGEGITEFRIGDRVIALAPESFGTYVLAPADFVVRIPDRLGFEEAATIPAAFLTASYALDHLAKMSAADRVLIHAAAGGVGMAAVQLALRAGAEIFATAGSSEKREFLRSLRIQHVMDSRSLDFADEVMECTRGQGVDIVLNSLAGEFIPKGLSVLGANGRFLEIGKRDIWDEDRVRQFRNDVTYLPLDLGEVCLEHPDLIHSMLCELMEAFEKEELKPLPLKVFPIEEAASAFRYMAQAKHIGKIVVSQHETVPRPSLEEPNLFRDQGTYLITGGCGGLGLLVARWMVEHGTRHLVLMSRSGASSAANEAIKYLEQAGAVVTVARGDVSKEEEVAQVLAHIAQSLQPLRGVVHAAGILDDGVLHQQDWERFEKVMAPKVEGAWNLHALTQNIPLDFFVLFSSVASLLGSPGQGNYAAANAFLDVLAHYRRAQELPALSINWGGWSKAGMAAALSSHDRRRWTAQGIGTMTPEQGLQALGQVLREGPCRVAVMPVNWPKFMQQFAPGRESLFLSNVAKVRQRGKAEQVSAQQPELLRQLAEASQSKRLDLLATFIRAQVARVLGIDPSQALDLQQPLMELGLDSLMAMELRNLLGASLGLERTLPATLVFEYPTINSLAKYLSQAELAERIETFRGARQGRRVARNVRVSDPEEIEIEL